MFRDNQLRVGNKSLHPAQLCDVGVEHETLTALREGGKRYNEAGSRRTQGAPFSVS